MSMVTLGSTGICVNKNGFGALPVQRVTKEDAVYLLRKAYDEASAFLIPRVHTATARKIRRSV